MQISLVLGTLLSLAWIAFWRKSLLETVLVFVASLSLAGVILTACNTIFGRLSTEASNQITLASIVLVAMAATFLKRPQKVGPFWLGAPIFGVSLLLSVFAIVARLRALPTLPNPLAGSGRFFLAEDNDKWLNFAAQLSQNVPTDARDGAGGAVAALLVITVALLSVTTAIFAGGTDLIAVNIQSVLVAHAILTFIAPLVLLIPLERLRPEFDAKAPNATLGRRRSFTRWVYLACLTGAAGVIGLAVLGLQSLGHLSFEVTLVSLAIWASFISTRSIRTWNLGVYLIAGSVFLAWMPIPAVSLVIVATGLIIECVPVLRDPEPLRPVRIVALALLLLVLIWLAYPSFREIVQTATPGTGATLVLAEGATLALSVSEGALILGVVIGTLLWIYARFSGSKPIHWVRFYPAVYLIGYVAMVASYEWMGHSDGWPHYGTRKLAFGFGIILFIALVGLAVEGYFAALSNQNKTSKRLLGMVAIFGFVTLIAISPNAKRGEQLFTETWWKLYDVTDFPAGFKLSSRLNPDGVPHQTLDSYPIACLPEPANLNKAQSLPDWQLTNYICTRFVIGMHGLDSGGYFLTAAAIGALAPSDIKPTLSKLDPKYLNLPVIMTKSDGSIAGEITLKNYLSTQ